MTRPRDKKLERHYVEFCARKLQADWKFIDDGEAPDFVLSDGQSVFGLEVTQAFIDGTPSSVRGSGLRRQEGIALKSMERIRREYEQETGATINATFTKRPSAADESEIVQDLIALGLHELPLATYRVIIRPNGMKIGVRRSCHPDWVVVADSAGRMDHLGHVQLQSRIAEKSPIEKSYREAVASDLRLLVVANQMLNSGKLVVEGSEGIDLMGFTRIYFVAYPQGVLVFPPS